MFIELLCAKCCMGHCGVERQQNKISGLKEDRVNHELQITQRAGRRWFKYMVSRMKEIESH